jgi:integration host factor subunit beta
LALDVAKKKYLWIISNKSMLLHVPYRMCDIVYNEYVRETRMNKSELIEAIAQQENLPHREASSITNTILETMIDTLASGESIEIRGFGSFVIKEYESYQGRNPKTGEKIEVPPKKLPFFKVGKELKERVNQSS